MSIEVCIRCSDPVDTDYNLDWYREGFNDQCICPACFEAFYECPECGSGETFMASHAAVNGNPEATSKNCHECNHQWDVE